MNREMLRIKQQAGVFCDSFVANDTGILFASFWGRNTSLQQFLARMELPVHEDGINQITFKISADIAKTFLLQDVKNMQKLSGRVANTIYGKDLSHIFIYDRSTIEINRSICKATILYFNNSKIANLAIWHLIKELSPIPLLDTWMLQIINICQQHGYINNVEGFGGVSGLVVQLDEVDFELSIAKMIKAQILSVA